MELLAYIDPGAGSLFIQALVATILVVPFFMRTQIRRAIDRLRGRPSSDPSPAATSVDVDPPTQP
jgi:hypothetical protein